ncbi:glycosyltransferase family 2 protein [Pedobacter agri]|uniref:glycosyltransferase family 2 protein n=1 Tax=Pedobacter agri TaxID=454586 RepID=UPI002931D8C9|nr:glycosyltransferase [Pedobacter agri]
MHIDIIFLSYAKNEHLKALTIQSIKTLLASEDTTKIQFNILVIESNKALEPYQFDNTTTIYPNEEFGFNKYLNMGIRASSNRYVCLCNNDLIFHKNWASNILKALHKYSTIYSANPFCDKFNYDERIGYFKQNIILRSKNPELNGGLTGWCIFVKREIFDIIGLLDEQFTFWYADNDYDLTLKKNNIEHALIMNSKVTHVACTSHDLLGSTLNEMTYGQYLKFQKKWHKKSIIRRALFLILKKLNLTCNLLTN